MTKFEERYLERPLSPIRLASDLKGNDKPWIAWWYVGFSKNRREQDQPLVLVAFHEYNNGKISGKVIHKFVASTYLGQVRIGSIWQFGICKSESILSESLFKVSYNPNKWRITSFMKSINDSRPCPFPPDLYPLELANDKSRLLEFDLEPCGKLIVPCIEFFTRCYGRSPELRRRLLLYRYSEDSEQFYRSVEKARDDHSWPIKLAPRLARGDAILLAHAKYNGISKSAVMKIYGNLEALYENKNDKDHLVFIDIEPWHHGPAQIKAEGIWFNEGRSFLALRITGYSDPLGPPIYRDREVTGRADGDGDQHGQPKKILRTLPAIVDLTDYQSPDNDGPMIDIKDRKIEILGEQRVIIDIDNVGDHGSTAHRYEGEDVQVFSNGDPQGTGKSIGLASFQPTEVLETTGMLRDMWDAMVYQKMKHPDSISSLHAFTFEDGFRESPDPSLIALRQFAAYASIDGETRNWVFMDPPQLSRRRGVLVARLCVRNKAVYFFEIQRRVRISNLEESFSGMVFTLDDDRYLSSWLRQLLDNVRHVQGRLRNLRTRCPGEYFVFRHRKSKDNKVNCVSTVEWALERVGLSLD
jgi:hypothetical protein